MIYDHVSGRLSALDRQIVDAVPPGGNWRNLPHDFPSKRVEQIRRTAADGKGSRSTYYGRLRPDRPAYTISTYFNRPGNGCYIHPTEPRLISVREAARLQGFPDRYRFTGKARDRFMQVGNAIPPLLAYQLAIAFPAGPFIDLFSGAGGLSLGLELAGFELIAAIDNDAAAVETIGVNHNREVALQFDLSEPAQFAKAMEVLRSRLRGEQVGLLAGGPPCQGFSTAGWCRPDDSRNRLMFAFLAAVQELRPKCVLIENVPALAWRGKEVLQEIQRSLHTCGYSVSVGLIHAEGYGIPQLRRRLFILATRADDVVWPQPWRRILAPSHLDLQPGYVSDSALDPVTVEEAIGDLPGVSASSWETGVVYDHAARSSYQQWARGEIDTSAVVAVQHLSIHSNLLEACERK